METERRHPRFFKQREGKAFTIGGWRKCSTVDVSRKGLCLRFHEPKKVLLGSSVYLEIPTFKGLKPICVEGILKWRKQEDSNYIGGVELNEALLDNEWVKLRDHFNLAQPQGKN